MLSKGKTIGLAILLIVVVGGAFFGLYYFSVDNANILFTNLTLEASNTNTFIADLLTHKKFKFTLTYDVSGGFLPVTCKNFTLNVKIEDLDVGSVRIDDFQMSGESNTETFLLDLSDLSFNDLDYVRDKFYDYGEELKVEIGGSARIDAIIRSKEVNPSINKYFLLGSPSIDLVDAYWEKTLAQAGETVDFHVEVTNLYRGHMVSGTLKVDVREAIGYADTVTYHAKTSLFSVSLDAGKSSDHSDSFTTYQDYDTSCFFLDVFWEGTLVYRMPLGYPPRLRISR